MRTYLLIIGALFCLNIFMLAPPNTLSESASVGEIERVSPKEAREKSKAGKALLVCAYDDEMCKDMVLDGSLLRSEFESKLPSLSKNQEIIFYCA